MSGISSFDDCGMWELSGDPNHAEDFYEILPTFWGDAIDQTPGSYDECKLYAWAMGLGRVHYELEHAGNQAFGDTAYDLLPLLELDYRIAPSPNDTVPERQAAVSAMESLPRGYTPANVVNGLKQILGTNFFAFARTRDLKTPTVSPSAPGLGPGLFADCRIAPRFLQLAEPVTGLGAPIWIAYEALDTSAVPSARWQPTTVFAVGALVRPSDARATGFYYEATTGGASTGSAEPTWPATIGATVNDNGVTWTCAAPIATPLHAGDVVVVQGENTASSEQIAVTAVSNTPPAGSLALPGYLYLEATFTKAHDAGASIVAANFPYWWSTQRHVFVIARAGGGVTPLTRDREARRKVDEFMARIARAVDTWAFVESTGAEGAAAFAGTIGPLQVGSPLGCVPTGTLTFSASM